jgi:Zn-dependent M28 family amino/carboxypeptidase
MKRMALSVTAFIFLVFSTSAQISKEVRNILNKIDPAAIKGNMTFLADDALEGRLPGTRGFALASKYMESQFISLGLQPGIDDTSYLQRFPMVKGWVDAGECSFILHSEKGDEVLAYGGEFLLNPYFASPRSMIKAPLVFAGFGVCAPEFNYDDYKNLDCRGKIVVYINEAPNTFPNAERAYYSSTDVKYSEAIKRGAAGIISFNLPSNKRFSWNASVRRAVQGSYKWMNKQGKAEHSYDALKAVVNFNNRYLYKLLAKAPIDTNKLFSLAAAGKSMSFPLNVTASIQVKTNTNKIEGSNIVGILKGSDPLLKNEYLVYSAHLDHFGIGAPVKNDSIYNGAHDDASGNAILLEIAKAYRSLSVAPKRSVIFAVVTGEEMGLLGSDYFINNFPVKNGKVIANMAIDMPFFFHPVLDIVPYGADHSSLGVQTKKAAQLLGLKISPDPIPEQVVFIRSDHYSFIKKGIPALFIKSGFMTVAGDTTNRARTDVAWRSSIYHTPQDDMNQPFDFKAATTHVKINFLTGYLICNDAASPAWNKGDFFGNKFKKTEQ